jgi:hypothetical protein
MFLSNHVKFVELYFEAETWQNFFFSAGPASGLPVYTEVISHQNEM